MLRLVFCVISVAIVLASTPLRGFGGLAGVESAYASCATTDYWNVSWCI
jgi:hypothetical protein